MREIPMRALDLLPRDVRNYERPASYVLQPAAWDRAGYDLADYRAFHLTERRRRIMQPSTSAATSRSWTAADPPAT